MSHRMIMGHRKVKKCLQVFNQLMKKLDPISNETTLLFTQVVVMLNSVSTWLGHGTQIFSETLFWI